MMSTPRELTFLVYNHHPMYQNKITTFIEQSRQIQGLHVEQIPNPILQTPSVTGVNMVDQIIPYIQDRHVDAVIHRNEHGVMHCTPAWNQVNDFCRQRGISVMSFDFGYFDHYKHFMVDYYQDKCVSSIYKEWDNASLSPDLFWNESLPSIQEYRHKILSEIAAARNEKPYKPLRGKKYVVIWSQWTTELIRHCFYEKGKPIKMDKWITMLADRIRAEGMIPIVKMSPVKVIPTFQHLQKDLLCIVGRKAHLEELPFTRYIKNANANLIAHAERHIICCSSVSNELVIAGAKVTAMGRSWFDNLGIFHEPNSWDDVLNYQQPDQRKVNRWINWWFSRQCLKQDVNHKFIEIYHKSKQ